MTNRVNRLLLVLLLTSAVHVQDVRAQAVAPAAPPPAFAPADKLPFDPAVTTGTLPNGLRYYIRRNGKPEQRVLMQLAVKAGSIDEADDQQGLAHFLEHMAFNGTRHFKAGELIATLESTGARMGPHVNAYTSFDETVYMFELPTNREGIVEKGLQALADFGGGMLLSPAEIDKERGVVIEEWRGGLGAGSRLRDQQIPALYYQSKYAERLPIGKPEILRSFTPERLRAFYTKWYRPDRMAVVVVGDLEPAKMEALIRTEFATIAKPAAAAPARAYPVPLPAEVLYKIATDSEATQSSISIVQKRTRLGQDTVADYRRSLVNQLVFQMINDWFDELSRKADAPFLSAGAYGGGLTPTVETVSLGAAVPDGKIEAGLAALAIESKRVREHGFGPAELDRAKKWTLAGYDRAFTERDKTESGSYVQEYVNYFLEGEPSPGIAYEHQLAHVAIPLVAQADVDAAAKALFSSPSRVILAVSPEKAGVVVPTEVQLKAALAATDAVAVTAWADTAMSATLMEHVPEPAPPRRGARSRSSASPSSGSPTASKRGSSPPTSKTTRCSSRCGAGRHVAGRARQVPRGTTRDVARRSLGRRRAQRGGAAEAAGRKDRLGLTLLHAVDAGDLRLQHAGEPRDWAAAPQPELHGPGQRRRGLRPDQTSARGRLRQPRQQPQRDLRGEALGREHDQPLHVAAAHHGADRHARSGGDGQLLPGAARQCR